MNWFSIKASTNSAPTEVSIHGDIGAWGVGARDFIAQVKAITGPILVRINSDGGDVFDGLTMFHFLRQRGQVETVTDGRALSAATLPFLAGSKRSMPKGAFLMVHNPWSGTIGDAAEMRKNADLLEIGRAHV